MSFYLGVLAVVALFAVSGMAAAVLDRNLRLTSLAHAAVMGTGAYLFAIASRYSVPFAGAAIIGLLGATLAGTVLVLLAHRVVGEDFALATFALQVAWFGLVVVPNPITGGALGLGGIPQLPLSRWLGVPLALMVGAGAVLVPMVWVVRRSERGPFHAASAVLARSDELAATLGIERGWVRLQLGGVYGLLLGTAGVLLASYLSFIDPALFATGVSVSILAVGAFAARGSILYVVAGSAVIAGVPQVLRLVGLSPARSGAVQLMLGGMAVAVAGAAWLRRGGR